MEATVKIGERQDGLRNPAHTGSTGVREDSIEVNWIEDDRVWHVEHVVHTHLRDRGFVGEPRRTTQASRRDKKNMEKFFPGQETLSEATVSEFKHESPGN